jgi:PIN domain nuclease of toxin-antitoxin system
VNSILLDTCALIWVLQAQGLSLAAQEEFRNTEASGGSILVSPISAWELGLLVAKGRIALPAPPNLWFKEVLDQGVRLAPLTPDILVESSFLPGGLHGDPADRIIAATARAHNLRVMTRDRPLLAYAAAGHVQAIAC